jgi:ABC-type lipoprotein release transport system permease subunit
MSGFFVDLRIALLSLVQHKRRTLFLGAAIAAVTALFTLLNGLSLGVRRTMVDTATTLATGHLNVGGFFKVTAGTSAPVVTEWKKVMARVREHVPEMRFAVQRGRGWASVTSDRGSSQLGINGIDIVDEPEFRKAVQVIAGNLDDLRQKNTILVFEDQLKKLDVKVGDAVTISAQTTRGVANTIDCRVAAIARDIGLLSKWSTFVSNETLRALYQLRPDATGAIQILLDEKHAKDIVPIAARLRTALERDGFRVMEADPRAFWMKFETVNRESWTGQKLDVTTWEDELAFMIWTLPVLAGLTGILMVVLFAIIVTGIMNTMWIAIRERTREIGALRAIGMRRGSVMRMFMLEALSLGVVATVAGALGGLLVAAILNAARIPVPLTVQMFLMSDHLTLAVDGGLLVGAVVLITCITGAAAVFPALRAARLRPVVAMSRTV